MIYYPELEKLSTVFLWTSQFEVLVNNVLINVLSYPNLNWFVKLYDLGAPVFKIFYL